MGTENKLPSIDIAHNAKPFSERHALAGVALTLAIGGRELLHEDTREVHPIETMKRIGSSVLSRVLPKASN